MFPTKKPDLVQALSLTLHSEEGYYQESHHRGRGADSSGGKASKEANNENSRSDVTSIYWIPDPQSPTISLSVAESDCILFYQGGRPFECSLYDPAVDKIERCVLGSDVCNGQILQLLVKGGVWKCGHMIMSDMGEQVEFTVIGEAVGTDIDADCFRWVTMDTLEKQCSIPIQKALKPFIRDGNLSSSDEDVEFLELGNQTDGDTDTIPLTLSPSQNRRLFQLNYI